MNNNEQSADSIYRKRYIFWMNDITVLYKDGAYIKFFPTSDMSRVEQLNALSRFFFYLIIIFLLFDSSNEWLFIPIVGIILCIILYNVFDIDENGKKSELVRMKRKNTKQSYAQPDINYRTYQVNDDGKIVTVDIDSEENERYNAETAEPSATDYELETGFYDSDGKINLNHGKYIGPFDKKKNDSPSYTMDEMRLYENSTCRRPSTNNPHMNTSVDDFNKENVPVACNSDDADIGKEVANMYNADLYRDIEDVFNKKNSQRQFYTVAHNVPNDQEAFARWCYKFPATCKTDQERCLRYEDSREKYWI